jgi:undecaprenyl-diphosphatase
MLKYIFLGVIQGLTEFLPVSSSAHLVILGKIFNIDSHGVALAVILHLGTLCSLVVFFYKEIIGLFRNPKLVLLIFITTLITGIIGILGKDLFERLFSQPRLIAIALLATAMLLLMTRGSAGSRRDDFNIRDASVLGFIQAIAIIPGISRSAATISTLLFRKIENGLAFKLSFLVSIPVILGAVILEARKISFALEQNQAGLIAGFIFSFLSGMISLVVLREFLSRARLYYFGYYCIFAAVFTFLFVK